MRSAAVLVSFLLLGCAKLMTPTTTPDPIAPDSPLELGTAAPGEGSVVVDATNGPTHVERVVSGQIPQSYQTRGGGLGLTTTPLCRTPCVAHLPVGVHQLRFVLESDRRTVDYGTVQVGNQRSAYRRTLTRRTGAGRAYWWLVLGSLAYVSGATLAGYGIAFATSNDEDDVASAASFGGIGGGMLLVGALSTILFVWRRPRVWPGSDVQWVPER